MRSKVDGHVDIFLWQYRKSRGCELLITTEGVSRALERKVDE